MAFTNFGSMAKITYATILENCIKTVPIGIENVINQIFDYAINDLILISEINLLDRKMKGWKCVKIHDLVDD
jgi:hypothetical protein